MTALRSLISRINPHIICNLAYPGDLAKPPVLKSVIVDGTRNLLTCAQESGSVEAFIYTSTQHVAKMEQGNSITEESSHVWNHTDKGVNPYIFNKALAETMVLKANNPPSIRTTSIRVPGIYGEEHCVIIGGQIKRLRKGEHKIQVGNNESIFEAIYAPSAASAHVLAAKALLSAKNDSKAPKVDGEAFFVSDDSPRRFWDFVYDVLAAAGDDTAGKNMKVVPFWVVFAMAYLGEWAYWVFTLGTKQPALRVSDIRFLREGSQFSISKAKERLGYKPLFSQEEGIKRSVKWALEHESENVEVRRQ
jgi:sterol-4alpha-carboxylate 3-dehydrogenase (decarboxylating)